MSSHSRVGSKPRVEYVNRSGDPVDPKTGRPVAITTRKNKDLVQYPHIPYPRSSGLHPNSKSIKKFSGKKPRKILPVKKTGAIFGNLDPIPTDTRVDPPPHHCFNCWQKGHTKPQCPRPVVDRYCHNCGRRGEDLLTCPRCAGPYQIFQQNKDKGDLNGAEIGVANDEADADEVLQQLIYQDEERRHKEIPREAQERHIGMAAYKEVDYRDDSPERYHRHSRETSPYPYDDYKSRRDEVSYSPRRDKSPYSPRRDKSPYRSRRDKSPYRSRRRESPARYAPEWGRNSHDRSRSPAYRHCDDDDDEYRGYRERRSSPYREGRNGRKSPTDDYSKHTNLEDNPVQEMLALIKSISHLPENTQDLIVRQVMDERQYKLRLKQEQSEPKEPTWP